jgi:hypothetical protein
MSTEAIITSNFTGQFATADVAAAPLASDPETYRFEIRVNGRFKGSAFARVRWSDAQEHFEANIYESSYGPFAGESLFTAERAIQSLCDQLAVAAAI